MAMALSPISGKMVGRRGPRLPLFLAGTCMSAGALMLTGLSASTPLAVLLISYAIFGIGFGAVNPPITYAAISGMPDNQAGVAAAVASTSRQVGQALGVAITGSILGTAAASAGTELASASHAAWWLIAACGIAVLVIGALSTSERAVSAARISSEQMRAEATPDALPAG
jgi:MFS family permease